MHKILTAKSLIGAMIQMLIFPLALFLPAGTVAWPQGWIFLILFYSFVAVTVRLLLKHNPTLLEERMSVFKPDRRGLDKMFLLMFIISTIWMILMPLDAVRFHWSQVPIWLQMASGIVLIGSFTLIYLTFRENAYLTPTVRFQEERGHKVVSSGPYQHVRHPMYSGFFLFFIGMALLLGSEVGLLLALVLIGMFVRRAVLEEQVLSEELPGYDRYMTKVQYRFIPSVY